MPNTTGASRTLHAFRVGAAVARALPEPVADRLARVAGFGAAYTSAERRAQVERNLRRVHGPDFGGAGLRRAVDATFESYARYWAESFRLPGTTARVLDAGMSYQGLEHLDAGLARGKGALIALPHLGGGSGPASGWRPCASSRSPSWSRPSSRPICSSGSSSCGDRSGCTSSPSATTPPRRSSVPSRRTTSSRCCVTA